MKNRLDVYLVEHGYFESREKAKNEILSGNVLVNEKRLKASDSVKETDKIRIVSKMAFVSRGGYKLDKAIKVFGLNLQDKVCIDIGASTGGFTDVMLQNGACHVYSVDVGYGQLHYKLRQDSRVTSMERCNARTLSKDMFNHEINFATMDVSFISILLIFPRLKEILNDEAKVMALIKPQFETCKKNVGKNGVVRDKAIHKEVINNIILEAKNFGLCCEKLDFSPIKGPEGNIEFISLFGFCDKNIGIDIDNIVEMAHDNNFKSV